MDFLNKKIDSKEVLWFKKSNKYLVFETPFYEIFKKLYGSPVENNAQHKCPYCKHEVNNSKFCRMCGAFPI